MSETLNVFQRLVKVQEEAKAPRSISGKFGKTRSAEQILEAYKPVCNAHGLYLQTSDEIKQVGSRNYIVATATVYNVDDPSQFVGATANAWEGEIPTSRSGGEIIDSSQLTGKTSSYAKKYALQNLFAIDDTKDSDLEDDNQNVKVTEYESKPKVMTPEDILADSKRNIFNLLILQDYVSVDSKRAFIKGVLKKETIDTQSEADSVLDAIENNSDSYLKDSSSLASGEQYE